MLKFAIIGAGAGGQSMAAILTSKGYIAKLYDIDKEKSIVCRNSKQSRSPASLPARPHRRLLRTGSMKSWMTWT